MFFIGFVSNSVSISDLVLSRSSGVISVFLDDFNPLEIALS